MLRSNLKRLKFDTFAKKSRTVTGPIKIYRLQAITQSVLTLRDRQILASISD